MKRKIYYHDTDSGGVVYYANYLKYFEEAREEFFSSLGIELGDLQKKGVLFVVARAEIDYKSPAHFQDELKIKTELKQLKHTSFQLHYKITNALTNCLIVEGITWMVCVNRDLHPQKIPKNIKTILEEKVVL